MKLTKSQLREIIREEIQNLTEAKVINVTTYGGKVMKFTNKYIKEFLADPGLMLSSDNLPKWLMWSKSLNQGVYNKKDKVKDLLQKILKHNGPVNINVREDKPYHHNITFD